MDLSTRQLWVRAVVLVGVLYFVVGWGFGELAKTAASEQMLFRWRLGAWVASALVYLAHIGYEHFRLNNSPLAMSLHAALAVGIGGFLLAVAATGHALMVSSTAPLWRYLIALVAWPLITAAPAFLASLLVTAVLVRLPTKR